MGGEGVEPTRRGFLGILGGVAAALGVSEPKATASGPTHVDSTTPAFLESFKIPRQFHMSESRLAEVTLTKPGVWSIEADCIGWNMAPSVFAERRRVTLHIRQDGQPLVRVYDEVRRGTALHMIGHTIASVGDKPVKITAFLRGKQIDGRVGIVAVWSGPIAP